MDAGLCGGNRVCWTTGLAKQTCRGAVLLCVCTRGGVTVTLRGSTLGGVPLTLRGDTLGGVSVTLRDCKRVYDSCWGAWFRGVTVGVNGGAGPFCVMAWMRSLTVAAVRSEGVTCGMVYVEGKKATLSLLRHALVAGMYMR